MAVQYGKFELPNKIVLEKSSATSTFGRFIAEPFERGYGHTVGNSMRRILLTSLESPSIVSVRIEGVPHEYTAIEGVVEDMTNIILNLKGALLRKLPTEEEGHTARISRFVSSTLDISQEDLDQNGGQYAVTLHDLVNDGSFEVVNPDMHVFTVTKPLQRQIDLRVSFGRGYTPSERHVYRDKVSDEILIDTAFSPVRLVTYMVENTRVGQDTDFDRLILEISTDGRVTPSEAVSFAAQIGQKHFDVFQKITTDTLIFEEKGVGVGAEDDELLEKLCLRIDEIELSVRSTNCLSGANIETIAELVLIPERKMLEFKNFGKKSLTEIKDKLHEMNLFLGMDLARYGITLENVKEKIREYQNRNPKETEE